MMPIDKRENFSSAIRSKAGMLTFATSVQRSFGHSIQGH
jgi:hypothetical protein